MGNYLGASYEIKKSHLNMHEVREKLTVRNAALVRSRELGIPASPKDVEFVELWDDLGDRVRLPRGCSPERFLLPSIPSVEHEGLELHPTVARVRAAQGRGERFGRLPPGKVRRELWPEQQLVVEAIKAGGSDNLIQLSCGKGKTTIAVTYAAKQGARTLVVVDLDFIADQWADEISEITGILPGAVGRLQADTSTVGARWTVALAKTLSARIASGALPQSWFDQFDLVVFDEVHVAACASLLTILPKFVCPRLGLSATPNRKDGMQDLFLAHLGGKPTYTNTERRSSARWIFSPTVRILEEGAKRVRVPTGKKKGKEASLYLPIPGTPYFRVNHAVHRAYAGNDGPWAEQVVKDVVRAVEAGRYVIVLGPTVEHLEQLTRRLEHAGVDVGCVTGKVKSDDRQDHFRSRRVVLATDKLASKALNIPTMNTLFLLYPSDDENFVMQASGRIDRGAVAPVILTYVHTYMPQLSKKAGRMRAICQKLDPGGKFEGWQLLWPKTD